MHNSSSASERDLIAAYETLSLDAGASPTAIKLRYRELARAHHPDRWLHGSREYAAATDRMSVINAAYELICNAPLQHAPAPVIVQGDDAETGFSSRRRNRRATALVETLARLAAGAIVGAIAAWFLASRGVPGVAWYGWVLPLLFALAFTSTSERVEFMLDLLLRSWLWTR